jgi:hypothetical protein
LLLKNDMLYVELNYQYIVTSQEIVLIVQNTYGPTESMGYY